MADPAFQHEDEFFTYALDIVRQAGRLVKDAFAQPSSIVMTKASDTDLVTATDKAVDNTDDVVWFKYFSHFCLFQLDDPATGTLNPFLEIMFIESISKKFSDHQFIGEESAADGKRAPYTDAPTWIIDPIDGTTNFVHRIPLIAICVGLTIKKQLRAGIVYNPITDELWTAQACRGAYKNGFPIRVSSVEAINKAIIAQSLGIHNIVEQGDKWIDIALANKKATVVKGCHGRHNNAERAVQPPPLLDASKAVAALQLGVDRSPALMSSFTNNFASLMVQKNMHGWVSEARAIFALPPRMPPHLRHRAFGSAAINMVYVAQGSVDAYVEYGIHSWDIAAAALIVLEAGGCVIDPTGKPFELMARKVLCAGTEKLARAFNACLTHVDYEPE